jgi:hypothetical protein
MLGNFMQKELALSEYANFCHTTQSSSKPCVLDEDNTASMYRDDLGWTIHRKRAWMAVLSQCHYDFIDFTVTVGNESGTLDSNRKIRTWMRYLSEFIHSFDFIRAQPVHNLFQQCPDHLISAVLGITDEEYVAYFADTREYTDPTFGEMISGDLSFKLPEGRYRISLFSPRSGEYSPVIMVNGGDVPITFSLPGFKHDIILRITRHDG